MSAEKTKRKQLLDAGWVESFRSGRIAYYRDPESNRVLVEIEAFQTICLRRKANHRSMDRKAYRP